MKVLVFSDLQATEGHERCHSNPALPLQRWRVEQFFTKLLDVYRLRGCEALWDLGDLLDDRSAVPVPTIDIVLAGLAKFPKSPFNYKLIGNHEQYLRSTALHAGRMFEPFFNVVSGRSLGQVGDRDVAMCAFPEDDASAAAWIAQTARPDRILIGHFQVSGCRMASGRSLAGIPTEALDQYGLALLGHVHSSQTLPGTNAFYVGSPFQQDFGEAGDEKFVIVLDTANLSVEWIKLAGFPEYKTLSLNEWASRRQEDRCKVILQSPAEAATFYADEDCGQAEPIYSYELAATASQESSQKVPGTDINSLMLDYVRERPPAGFSTEVSEIELLELGRHIIES